MKSLKVLDVGCGNGQMTLRYVEELKKTVPHIHLSLLDPAVQSLQDAKILLEPTVLSIETLKEKPSFSEFDLIIASYVFYHLSPETIHQITKLLAPGGSIAIMMGTNNHPFKSHPKLLEVSRHGSSDKLNPFLDTIKSTSNFNISRHQVPTKMDLNGLWKNKSFTPEGKQLLSFSLNKDFNDLETTAKEALNEIFEHAFSSDEGFIKPVHELIWIERIR